MSSIPHLVDSREAILVVIDVQERLAAAMPHRERAVAAVSRLVRTAALLGWPIVVTRQNPAGLGGLVPELAALLASAELAEAGVRVVDKTAFCACLEPGFGTAMGVEGRRQAVVCGMEAHICVTQTALGLLAQGREVFVPTDACCSIDDADSAVAFERMRAGGVEVLTSQAVMYEAVREAGTDEFRAVLGIVKGLRGL